MKQFSQHKNTTTYSHVVNVAMHSYKFAKKHNLKIDERSLIRGALLHDYYLYDWHVKEGRQRLHGYRHPRIALENASKEFELNKIEQDIIKKHMWPLTLFKMPRYKESFIVCYFDKVCAIKEMFSRKR